MAEFVLIVFTWILLGFYQVSIGPYLILHWPDSIEFVPLFVRAWWNLSGTGLWPLSFGFWYGFNSVPILDWTSLIGLDRLLPRFGRFCSGFYQIGCLVPALLATIPALSRFFLIFWFFFAWKRRQCTRTRTRTCTAWCRATRTSFCTRRPTCRGSPTAATDRPAGTTKPTAACASSTIPTPIKYRLTPLQRLEARS